MNRITVKKKKKFLFKIQLMIYLKYEGKEFKFQKILNLKFLIFKSDEKSESKNHSKNGQNMRQKRKEKFQKTEKHRLSIS